MLDTAKLLSVIATGESVRSLTGTEATRRVRRVVAVPTTAGSGSEMTRTAIVSLDGIKSWVWGEALRPESVVLDPDVTVGLGRMGTIASGLDAFVHAVEAVTASSTIDSLAHEAGLWAIGKIVEHLPVVIARPADIGSREAMLGASAAAGLAIDRCGTGIAHALGHGLGSVAPIAHGLSVALALEVTAEWSAGSGDPRCDVVARTVGADTFGSVPYGLSSAVGLSQLVGSIAAAHPVDRGALTSIVLSQVNAPMRSNNVRPASERETSELVGRLVDRWDQLGGRR